MPRHEDFEAELLRDPTAVTPYLVYADWLQERDEEHGRLITVQHALEQSPHDPALTAENERLCARYLAPLGKLPEDTRVEWRRGFVRELVLPQWGEGAAEVLQKLLRLKVGMLLSELTVGFEVAGVVELLAKQSPPLTRLFLGDFESPTGDLNGISWLDLGDVEPLWAGLPRLRDLTLLGLYKLGRIEHGELRRFEARTGNLDRVRLEAIVSARWPKLEELRIWFGDSNYGAECQADDVRPILDGRGLGGLRRLGLMNAEFADQLCPRLPGSKILPQLEELDLSMGTLSDAGAEALLANDAAFRHLKKLELGRSYLSEEMISRLRERLPQVALADQRRAHQGDRYVTAGE